MAGLGGIIWITRKLAEEYQNNGENWGIADELFKRCEWERKRQKP